MRELYLQHEAKVAPRTRARRPADQQVFDRQIEAIVADLAYEYRVSPARWLSVTFSKSKLGNQGRYGSTVLNKTFPTVVKLLSDPELGLVDRIGGSRFDWDGDGVKQTAIKADSRLVGLINEYQVDLGDLRLANTGEVIILRRARESVFDDKDNIDYEDTEATQHYREEVQRLNRWLEEAEIDFDEAASETFVDARERHVRRIFNNGSFEQGGRLFGGFWQSLRKEQRRKGILINGNPVTTLDFGQIAPRIMYGMADAQPAFEDAYSLPKFDPSYRRGIKKLFNAMLHMDKRPVRFPAGIRDLIPDTSTKVGDVVDAILQAHAPIAPLFFTNQGLRVMFIESQILVAVLLKLMEQGIIALPVHDALVVERGHAPMVKEVMVTTFRAHTGVSIPVATDDGD